MNSLTPKNVLANMDHSYLRRLVHDSYLKKEVALASTLLSKVNEDPKLPNLNGTTFSKLLKSNKICVIAKGGGRRVLVDREYVQKRRMWYIQAITKARENKRPIYYLIETCFRLHQKIVWYTVRSEQDFELIDELLFECQHKDHYDVNYTKSFKEWFETMLAKLKPDAVLVMNDNKYKKEDMPQKFWPNQKIFDWITSKGIPFVDNLTGYDRKTALLKTVKREKRHYEYYNMDDVAKDLFPGVDVLITPLYHDEVKPMNRVSEDMARYVKEQKGHLKINFSDVKKLLDGYEMPLDVWRGHIDTVLEEEKRLYHLDEIMQEVINGYLGYAKGSQWMVENEDDFDSDSE